MDGGGKENVKSGCGCSKSNRWTKSAVEGRQQHLTWRDLHISSWHHETVIVCRRTRRNKVHAMLDMTGESGSMTQCASAALG